MVRANDLTQIKHYKLCKKKMASCEHLAFTEVMSFNRHLKDTLEFFGRFFVMQQIFCVLLIHVGYSLH